MSDNVKAALITALIVIGFIACITLVTAFPVSMVVFLFAVFVALVFLAVKYTIFY